MSRSPAERGPAGSRGRATREYMCYGAAPWCPISCFTFLSVDFRDLIPLMAVLSARSASWAWAECTPKRRDPACMCMCACRCLFRQSSRASRCLRGFQRPTRNQLLWLYASPTKGPRASCLPSVASKFRHRHPILRTGKLVHTSSPHSTARLPHSQTPFSPR